MLISQVPFMCFLLTATFFTVIFVFTAQSFCIAETPEYKNRNKNVRCGIHSLILK